MSAAMASGVIMVKVCRCSRPKAAVVRQVWMQKWFERQRRFRVEIYGKCTVRVEFYTGFWSDALGRDASKLLRALLVEKTLIRQTVP